MKKISLKSLDLTEVEQLSHEQLKDVLGGYSGVAVQAFNPPTSPGTCDCNTVDDCPTTDPSKPQDCMNSGCSGGGKAGQCGWNGQAG